MNKFAETMGVGIAGFAVGVGGLGLAGFSIWDCLFSDEKLYKVQLIPQGNPSPGNPGVLKVNVEKGKKCSNNPHDGCMLFEHGKQGVIGLYLNVGKKKIGCSTDPSKNAGKVITRVELTSKETADPSKGDFKVDVADWLKYDAFPGMPDNGDIYNVSKDNGRSRVSLFNSNSHLGGQDKSFWYRVTVTDCDDPTKQWVTDPRGDNEGLW